MTIDKNNVDPLEILEQLGKVHMGNNVRRLRIAAGIKQDYLAATLGITQQAISKLEQREVIDDETLEKIAPLLGVTVTIIKNLIDDTGQNTSNFFDYSQQNNATHITFNPIDKVVELCNDKDKLYEIVIESEKDKFNIVKDLLTENREYTERIFNLFDDKSK